MGNDATIFLSDPKNNHNLDASSCNDRGYNGMQCNNMQFKCYIKTDNGTSLVSSKMILTTTGKYGCDNNECCGFYEQAEDTGSSGLSGGIIALIIIGSIVFVALIGVSIVCYRKRSQQINTQYQEFNNNLISSKQSYIFCILFFVLNLFKYLLLSLLLLSGL